MTAVEAVPLPRAPEPPLPLVVVTLGTDHHPFDRLVEWVDRWAAARAGAARVLVQHGATRGPALADGVAFLPREELLAAMATAALVVTQGGPGSVMDARASGRRPVVVPRSAALGEHVDDHQQAFARHLHRADVAALALSEDDLAAHLDRALAEPEAYRTTGGEAIPAQTSRAVASVVDELLSRPRGPLPALLRRLTHR